MNDRTAAIWARIPEADRDLIRAAPTDQRDRWVDLWACAEANGRRAGSVKLDTEARERLHDELDELLLARVSRGEYGAKAARVAASCASEWPRGADRRGFLRAVRKAVRRSAWERQWKAGT